MNKAEIRSEILKKRQFNLKSITYKKQVLNKLITTLQPFQNIAIYLATSKEIDISPIVNTLTESRFFAPIWKDNQYVFKEIFLPIQIIGKDPYSIPIVAHKDSPIDQIDAYCVPGLAFSNQGGRIGYGKGIYDQLLLNQTGIKIGIAEHWQVFETLDQEPHDIKMDYLVTNQNIINCQKTRF